MDVDEVKFSRNIWGFTYWKRVLKYLDIDGYKTTDLVECYSLKFGKDLASFTTAAGIASILLKCVDELMGSPGINAVTGRIVRQEAVAAREDGGGEGGNDGDGDCTDADQVDAPDIDFRP